MNKRLNPSNISLCIALSFLVVSLLLLSPAWSGINQWTGSGPEGGYITSIAVSPNYVSDGTLFAGTEANGLYKSSNGGQNWVQSGLAGTGVGSLAFSPNYATDKTVFAGTGNGVYRSSDGGQTWTPTALVGHPAYSLVVSPDYANDHTLFAGSYGAVFISTNEGQSWSQSSLIENVAQVYSLAISPDYETDGTIFAGTYQAGVYKSTDRGQTWTQVNNGLTNTNIYSVAISPNYGSDSTIFAGCRLGGIYKSTNGGQTWTQVSGSYSNSSIGSFAFSPNYANDNTVFAGSRSGSVWKSTNAGQTWTPISNGPPTYVYATAISPNYTNDGTVFAGSSGSGVSKSIDRGQTWALVNSGLTNTYATSIDISSSYASDRTIFAGTQYNGVHKSTDGGQSWIPCGNTERFITSIAVSTNYMNDRSIFAGSYTGQIYKSTDRGQSWVVCGSTGLNYTYTIAISPNYASDSTVLASSAGAIYKFNGQSWTSVFTSTHYISDIAFSPNYANDSTIYAGTDGVYKSSDGGQNWSATALTNQSVYSLATSPNYGSDHAIFAGGYNQIFLSTDEGLNWTQISLGYTAQVNSLAVSPNYASDGTIFAGTSEAGVYISTNRGQTWTQVNDGLGILNVKSVSVSPNYISDHTVFSASYGGGVSSYTLSASAHTVTASAGANGSISPTGAVSASHGTTQAFTVIPSTNYYAVMSGTCGGNLVGTTYTTNPITSDCTVIADFTMDTHTVTVSAGANGTISPSGSVTVNHGSTQAFIVTPSANYHAVMSGTCGGNLVGTTYTTNAVTADCTVIANFEMDTHTVTASAGANGGISPSSAVSVNHGATQAFTVTPSANYHAVMSGTCGGNLVDTTYTTNAVTVDCTVIANFTLDTHTITASAGANGGISPLGSVTVNHGATQAFTVTPSANYHAVMSGTCGGDLVGTTYTTNAITADCTVIANFDTNGTTVCIQNGICITFSQVSNLCTSSSSILGSSPGSAPSGYTFIGNIYEISTCATYSGSISVTIPYEQSLVPYGKEGTLKMFHWNGSSWDYVPCTVNTLNHTMTGQVNSLSPFGIGYSSGSGGGYSTGANTNMISILAMFAISMGVFILRRNRWLKL